MRHEHVLQGQARGVSTDHARYEQCLTALLRRGGVPGVPEVQGCGTVPKQDLLVDRGLSLLFLGTTPHAGMGVPNSAKDFINVGIHCYITLLGGARSEDTTYSMSYGVSSLLEEYYV